MNWLTLLFQQPFTVALGWALLHFLWQGALVALLLGFANLCLRRARANLRYAAACTAMLLMLVAGVGTFLWLDSSARPAPGDAREILASLPAFVTGHSVERAIPDRAVIVQIEVWVDAHLAWLVSVWFAGVALLSLRTAGGWMCAQRLKRQSTSPTGSIWQERLMSLARRLEISRCLILCESRLAAVPTVIGWLRPVILLPASALTNLTPEMMEALLAHELAHIRRHDYLLNLLQTAVETLLFYHPAVWWVGRTMRLERENCCDDVAVASCGNALTYARALTELEQLRCSEPQLALAANGGSLIDRIRRLVGVRQHARTAPSLWVAAVIVLSVGTLWAASQISLAHGKPPMFAGLQFAQAASTTSQAEPAPSGSAGASSDAQIPAPSPSAAPSADAETKDFIGATQSAGYKNLTVDQLVQLKIHGVTPEFVRKIEAAGLGHPAVDELVKLQIHGVTPEYMNELKSSGFTGLSLDRLVAFRIHGVEPERVKQFQKIFGKVTADQLIQLQIHGVTPEFVEQLKNLGFSGLDVDQATAFQIHGVDPAKVAEIQKIFGKVTADQLIQLQIHGVTPEYIEELKKMGFSGLDVEQATAFQIHGVDPAKVAEIQKLGFGPLSADRVVELQIHDVSPEFLQGLKDLGFTKLTLDEAVAARNYDVTPAFVKAVQKHGYTNLTMEQIIKLKQYDILSSDETK